MKLTRQKMQEIRDEMTRAIELNRQKMQEIRDEINAAIKEIGEKHSVAFSLGNIKFSTDDFRATLKGDLIKEKTEKEAFWDALSLPNDLPTLVRASARDVVLPKDLQGLKFKVHGRIFTLNGVKKSRPKYPYQGIGSQGGHYKFTVEQVAKGIM